VIQEADTLTTLAVNESDDRRKVIIEEAERIEHWAEAWNVAFRRNAMSWRRINTVLVVFSALLAAIAAGGIVVTDDQDNDRIHSASFCCIFGCGNSAWSIYQSITK
jgi:hypothetical protein